MNHQRKFGIGVMLTALVLMCTQTIDAQLVPDPQRDLSVTFSSRHNGREPGAVVGVVRNNSANAYRCVRIEFDLYTRFDLRLHGQEGRHLGVLPMQLENLQPGGFRAYEQALPFPAGIGLRSVTSCASKPFGQTGIETPGGPKIVSFTLRPDRVRNGEAVIFTWQTVNAQRVFLGELNQGFPHSLAEPLANRIEVPSSGSQQLRALSTKTYRLQAVAFGRATTKDLILNVYHANTGPCIISGEVTGRLSAQEELTNDKGMPLGKRVTRFLREMGLYTNTAAGMRLVLRTQLDPPAQGGSRSSYRFRNVEAGRSYTVAPLGGWNFHPRSNSILCTPNGFHPMNVHIESPVFVREG